MVPTSSPPLEPLQVHADAEWVRDGAGRVVLLRGANYSGLEFGNFIGSAHGPREANFARMASWGFNVIRLPIAWNYIEPVMNQFSDRYLIEQVDPVVAFAARHGLVVILDMHQFEWSAYFTNGNGAPAWVCDERGYADDQSGQLHAACDFFQGALAPDGRTLIGHFVDAWRVVARHYAGDVRIAGFDFFNEPIAYTCFAIGVFETRVLNPFYRQVRAAVAAEGAGQTFFFCPSITRNVSIPTVLEPMGPNVVYAPHLYTETGGAADRAYDGNASRVHADYNLATRESTTLGGPLFAGEFGGNTDVAGGFRSATEQFLRDSLAEQEARLVGGAVWAYFPSDNTFSIVDASGQEKGELVDVLVRPFARRVAGIPTAMHFDLDTKEFSFSFRNDDEQRPPDPTEIFVPTRQYPLGFRVDIGAGDRWEYDRNGQRVLLFRGPVTEHTLHILPTAVTGADAPGQKAPAQKTP